jgi:hypothetical protein
MAENIPNSMNPNALRIDEAAKLLTKAGGRIISESMLRQDIDAGAPTNHDGTLNLVHYAAWLVKEMSGRTDGD